MAELNKTPNGERLHIGFFGKMNSGKSSLINAFTSQEVSIVSSVGGTTTDVVYKSMELQFLGPCVLMDTAGIDDQSELSEKRLSKTNLAMEKADIAVILFYGDEIEMEIALANHFKKEKTPVVAVISKADEIKNKEKLKLKIQEETGLSAVFVSSFDEKSIANFREELLKCVPDDFNEKGLTEDFVSEGDTVLLVMPQDKAAPKGRLILPQAQTIRDLLEEKCTVVCTDTERLTATLSKLKNPPELIITDSKVFKEVAKLKSKESKLTSFSVLFANYKGDIGYFVKSANEIENLTENSRILIAELCSHAPLEEDIGRVKIPALLRKKLGDKLTIDFVRGIDFPADLKSYNLIIECGGCMFGRKYLMTRVKKAKEEKVPMTNYGIVIAYLQEIIDDIKIV